MIIVGCGYSGGRMARQVMADGGRATAIVRSNSSRAALMEAGVDTLLWDLEADATSPALPGGEPVIYLVPPPASGDGDPRLAAFLERLPAEPSRIVYVSTTGVYGNRDGAKVDEDTPPHPETDRARRRVFAENLVQHWAHSHHIPWVILRVPGIYGPGRLPFDSLQSGRPLLQPGDASPGNRIHVDDLIECLCAAATTPAANQVFNVGDGDETSQTGFVNLLADMTGAPLPATADVDTVRAAAGESRWSFMRESRRVDVHRMREVLGVRPRYAHPADGIAASLTEMGERSD